jgi:hypothetical protein
MAKSVTELVSALSALPDVQVKDAIASRRVDASPHFPAIEIGPQLRHITVVYSGPIRWVPDPEYEQGLRIEAANAPIRDLTDELRAACKRESTCLWYGHSGAGIGCWYLHDAGGRWTHLAEQIRLARNRSIYWPGVGHEKVLEELMAEAR